MRALSTAIPIRPSGVTNSAKPPSTHHQLTVTSHGAALTVAATLLISASHTTHCRPVSVASGSDIAT